VVKTNPGMQIVAHEETRKTLASANDPNRPLPTQTFNTLDVDFPLVVGNQQLLLRYPGPNHDAGIGIYHPGQKVLMLVDVVYPGDRHHPLCRRPPEPDGCQEFLGRDARLDRPPDESLRQQGQSRYEQCTWPASRIAAAPRWLSTGRPPPPTHRPAATTWASATASDN